MQGDKKKKTCGVMMAISYVSDGDEKIDKAANPQKVKYHTHTKSHADTSEIS